MVAEIMIVTIIARGIEFAIVVVMVAAGARAGLIDATTAIGLEVCALSFEQQVPGAIVNEGMHALVRYLPEQVGEIQLGVRCVDLLRDVGAAG